MRKDILLIRGGGEDGVEDGRPMFTSKKTKIETWGIEKDEHDDYWLEEPKDHQVSWLILLPHPNPKQTDENKNKNLNWLFRGSQNTESWTMMGSW